MDTQYTDDADSRLLDHDVYGFPIYDAETSDPDEVMIALQRAYVENPDLLLVTLWKTITDICSAASSSLLPVDRFHRWPLYTAERSVNWNPAMRAKWLKSPPNNNVIFTERIERLDTVNNKIVDAEHPWDSSTALEHFRSVNAELEKKKKKSDAVVRSNLLKSYNDSHPNVRFSTLETYWTTPRYPPSEGRRSFEGGGKDAVFRKTVACPDGSQVSVSRLADGIPVPDAGEVFDGFHLGRFNAEHGWEL